MGGSGSGRRRGGGTKVLFKGKYISARKYSNKTLRFAKGVERKIARAHKRNRNTFPGGKLSFLG